MKSFIFALLLFVASTGFATDFVNGSFYVDNNITCQLISQNGVIESNTLPMGKTIVPGDRLTELNNSQNATLYFSGGPSLTTSTNSEFSINYYEVELKNPQESRKAEFGAHNLSLMFNKGDFSVIYTNNVNSMFIISTPYISYELQGGKYFFRVTDRSSVVYVIEGALNVHGDKKVDKTDKGNIAVALPYDDPLSGLKEKVVTSVKEVKKEESKVFTDPVVAAEKNVTPVEFYVIDGKPIGILK